MKKLKSIPIHKIDPDTSYYVSVTRYDYEGATHIFSSTGLEIISELKGLFRYDSDEHNTISDFLKYVESVNGDGWDLVFIYKA